MPLAKNRETSVSGLRARRRPTPHSWVSAPTTTSVEPPEGVPPPPENATGRRRKRKHRGSVSREARKAWRTILLISVQVVFIGLLIYLWTKIAE